MPTTPEPIAILSCPRPKRGYTYIYALRDPTTEEVCYVGQAFDPIRRFSQHSIDLRIENFWNAWLVYLGQVNQNFEMLVLDCVPKSKASQREREIISLYWSAGEPLMNQNHLHRGGVRVPKTKVLARIERSSWYRQYRINCGNDPDDYWWNE